jgi:predicted patatin/cPLA2 family phospholipase
MLAITIYLFLMRFKDLSRQFYQFISQKERIQLTIAMSCSIPLLFPPIEYQGDHYIDGGLFMHCPLPPNEKTIVLYIKNTSKLTMETPFHMIHHILVQSSKRLSPCITIGKRIEYAIENHGLDPLLWEKNGNG